MLPTFEELGNMFISKKTDQNVLKSTKRIKCNYIPLSKLPLNIINKDYILLSLEKWKKK